MQNAAVHPGGERSLKLPDTKPRTPMRIAILHDDLAQACLISHFLRSAGHEPHAFERGASLADRLTRESFDALVLDWDAPDGGSVEALDHIRKRLQLSLPILVTGPDTESDVVAALRRGADGYMVKPLRGLELVARLDTLVRRNGNEGAQPLQVDPFHVDFHARTIECNGRRLPLTATDFDLATLFLSNIGRLLSRGHLRESVWRARAVATSRTLDTYVSRVRNRLGLIPEHGWQLESVYGYGYRLKQIESSNSRRAPAHSGRHAPAVQDAARAAPTHGARRPLRTTPGRPPTRQPDSRAGGG
jgi:DNA-binding response OmpR family regulator